MGRLYKTMFAAVAFFALASSQTPVAQNIRSDFSVMASRPVAASVPATLTVANNAAETAKQHSTVTTVVSAILLPPWGLLGTLLWARFRRRSRASSGNSLC